MNLIRLSRMGHAHRNLNLREEMQLTKRNTLVRYATHYGIQNAHLMTKDELVDILVAGCNQGVEKMILENE